MNNLYLAIIFLILVSMTPVELKSSNIPEAYDEMMELVRRTNDYVESNILPYIDSNNLDLPVYRLSGDEAKFCQRSNTCARFPGCENERIIKSGNWYFHFQREFLASSLTRIYSRNRSFSEEDGQLTVSYLDCYIDFSLNLSDGSFTANGWLIVAYSRKASDDFLGVHSSEIIAHENPNLQLKDLFSDDGKQENAGKSVVRYQGVIEFNVPVWLEQPNCLECINLDGQRFYFNNELDEAVRAP